MAFRASSKSAKKSDSSEKPPVTEEATPVFSIDDVVGSPLQEESTPRASGGLVVEETPEMLPTAEEFVKREAGPAAPVGGEQRSEQRGGWRARPSAGFGSERRSDFHGPRRFGDRNPGYSSDRQPRFGDRGPSRFGGGSRFGGSSAPTSWRRDNRFAGGRDNPVGSDFTRAGETLEVNVPTDTVRGILDMMPEGHGFLRPKFTPSDKDVYISQSQIRRFVLRNGDMVQGQARQPKDNERYWGLLKVEKINDVEAEKMQDRPRFDDLTAIYPNRHLKLETGQSALSTRIIDLVAPVGFGQRALIVSPPKAGKTTILKELAAGIAANYPNVHLMAALIGERPEEVTDLSRSIKGEVLASNFDQSPQEQTRIAEVTLDRAKRLVEMGRDVVVLLDSVTRLARAYNLVVNPSGRTLSGGFDPAALYPAKKFLGAARCVEAVGTAAAGFQWSGASPVVDQATLDSKSTVPTDESASTQNAKIGGSLTVIGTALVDTGSRMDDLIYEEFKGTGNMELHLSRILQERRIFPAIDVGKSGTRHDELLLGEEVMKRVITLRHMLSLLSDDERTVMLIDRLGKTKNNAEFLESLGVGA